MNRHSWDSESYAAPHRGGFTLVEMLVSVALVLLIMTLFAQAFGLAAGEIRKYRGIAENDQRARSMSTIVLGDLEKRTFRERKRRFPPQIQSSAPQLDRLQTIANNLGRGIVPLHPDYFNGGNGGSTPGSTGNSTRQPDRDRERGYFYYSEGDPFDDSDDVLQFTVDVSQTELGNEDTTPLIGRARLIMTPDVAGNPTWFTWQNGLRNNPYQPIWDDLDGFQLDVNKDPVTYQPAETGASQSRYAEISYFIRAGRLHRRVMLIRDPHDLPPGALPDEGQPSFSSGASLILNEYDIEDGSPTEFGTTDFWNDFDFSATWLPLPPPTTNVRFGEIASLTNGEAGVAIGMPAPFEPRYLSLGNPQNRFGHDPMRRNQSLQGRPKEHWNPNVPSSFLGRYTHEETSHHDFRFPGFPDYSSGGTPTGNSPMTSGTLTGIQDANGDQVTDIFANGPRTGEDILLPNCHAFDVKVWDDEIKDFVDIGHARTDSAGNPGDLHQRQVLNSFEPWDPTPGTNDAGRFQAAQQGMHRYGSLNSDLTLTPRRFNRVFDTWHPEFDFDTNREGRPGTGPPATDGSGSADDVPPFRPLWSERDSFNDPISIGGSGGAAPYLNGAQPTIYEPGITYARGDRVFPRPDQDEAFHGHQSLFYVATPGLGATDFNNMATGTDDPDWSDIPGGGTSDGEILWKAVNNTIGLQAIQITVRFYDPTSGQIRQLTLTHPFVE